MDTVWLLKENERLKAESESLRVLLTECVDDLESEIEGHYHGLKDHPAMTKRYQRDMDVVYRVRAFLTSHLPS